MLINIKNVFKHYEIEKNKIQILKHICLEIAEGDYVAIMGPSGSGKSTLMNILGCLDYVSSGHYFLDDIEVAKLDQRRLAEIRRQKIGFIFQTFNLIPRLSALENVELPMIYDRRKNSQKKAELLLKKVGLSHRMHHLPNQLSGGERQRVAIARSLVNEPKIILADEPTGNLDSKSGIQIMQMISELNQQGKTIIMVTHDQNIAQQAERIITIKDGSI